MLEVLFSAAEAERGHTGHAGEAHQQAERRQALGEAGRVRVVVGEGGRVGPVAVAAAMPPTARGVAVGVPGLRGNAVAHLLAPVGAAPTGAGLAFMSCSRCVSVRSGRPPALAAWRARK